MCCLNHTCRRKAEEQERKSREEAEKAKKAAAEVQLLLCQYLANCERQFCQALHLETERENERKKAAAEAAAEAERVKRAQEAERIKAEQVDCPLNVLV